MNWESVSAGAFRGSTTPSVTHSSHSSGLSDEYPTIAFDNHHQREVTPGMVFSIEAYVGAEDEDEGLKLEEQVVITPDGVELLSRAPHDDRLSIR